MKKRLSKAASQCNKTHRKSILCLIVGTLFASTGLAGNSSPVNVSGPFSLPANDNEWYQSTITLNLSKLYTGDLGELKTRGGALYFLDGTQNDNEGRIEVQWWNPAYFNKTDSLYSIEANNWDTKTNFPGTQPIRLVVTNDSNSGGFNLGWDFEDENKNPSTPKDYSPAIANFRSGTLNASSPDRYLKHYVFESTNDRINIVTRGSIVSSTNAGDSTSMLGLSVSNKRGWMTFEDSTYLISNFKFDPDGEWSQPGESGTVDEFIAAGVYTAFGAQQGDGVYEHIFEQSGNDLSANLRDKETMDKYGLIEFEQKSVVSVNAFPSVGAEGHLLNEVFGVFSNEGGNVEFINGGDIVVKGRNNHHLVSAIAVASTYGVLDPLKLGKVSVNATQGLNRIWGWSDSYSGTNPHQVVKAEDLFDGDKLNQEVFTNLDTLYSEYLTKATSSKDTQQSLRSSVIAANGAEVSLTDGTGYFDIRGDVIAGLKNGTGAKSNTFCRQEDDTATSLNVAGTVTRAEVSITLSNPGSTLVGNVYERHRVGEAEIVKQNSFSSTTKVSESFPAWQQYQWERETESLGGLVRLELSGGATWYPVKNWCGWNFDILYNDFTSNGSLNPGYVVNQSYAYYDASDQYNLNIWEEGKYKLANQPTDLDPRETNTPIKINDLDLLDGDDHLGIPVAQKKAEGFTEVDNGVYHLKLNGGIVDLYYLRNDFLMSADQSEFGSDYVEEGAKGVSGPVLDGVKRFRIQALAGNGGTIRMYAKDALNHDLLIVDELRSFDNERLDGDSSTLNLVFWNNDASSDLGIRPGDATTYVYVARVPENVNITAQSYGLGRTTYTDYLVEKDTKVNGQYVEGSWTQSQKLEWHELNDNWFITGGIQNKVDEAVVETTESAANLGYLMATTMETLRDRRGEMRFNGTQQDGWWIRYTHNNFGMTGFTARSDGFQMGYEYEANRDEDGRTFRGLAIDAAYGDIDYSDVSGQSTAHRYRLSAYQTYVAEEGFYYDLIGRAGWYDAETNLAYVRRSNGTLYNVKGDFDYWAAALSFETGKRWKNTDAWWFEPEIQLQYTYIDDFDYRSSQGVLVDSDETHSLIGRFGLRGGKVLTNETGRKMNIWLGADILHEWLGDRDGSMVGVDHTILYDVSGKDTWYNAVFGLTWETGTDSRIWTTAKHSFGGDKEDCWSVNLGATWNF